MSHSAISDHSRFAALIFISACRDLRDGGRVLRKASAGIGPDMFESTCKSLQSAHDFGLTRIREIIRDRDGSVSEIVFEQVLTPAGQAVLYEPPPVFRLDEDVRRSLRQRLERQLETGLSGGSPMINGRGEPAGDLSDYLSPEQIRANAKRQLELMDEEDRRRAARDSQE